MVGAVKQRAAMEHDAYFITCCFSVILLPAVDAVRLT